MDAQVIPFPARPDRGDADAPDAGGGALALRRPVEEGEAVTEVVLDLRRLVHEGVRLSHTAERALVGRCATAAMRRLVAHGGNVRLAGTEDHPVVQATFRASDVENVARGVIEGDEAVRLEGGSEFVIAAGAACGRESALPAGGTSISGAPSWIASSLADKAAPGQILLGGAEWIVGRRLRVRPAADLEAPSGPLPVFVLRGWR